MSGAAPMKAELTEQFKKVLPNADIGQSYGEFTFFLIALVSHQNTGMTETCTVLTMYPYMQHYGVPGSAGPFIPGVVARVMREDGSRANVGEIGELWVTGPQVTLGYFNNEEAYVFLIRCSPNQPYECSIAERKRLL